MRSLFYVRRVENGYIINEHHEDRSTIARDRWDVKDQLDSWLDDVENKDPVKPPSAPTAKPKDVLDDEIPF